MNTETAQRDKRHDFRFPLSGQAADAELLVGDRRIYACLRNESSGGFGLYVEGEPPVKKDDIIEISVRDASYRCRVAYVRPCSDDSRIQIAEQDESGEIKTIVDPDEQERFCIGVERIEELSLFRKTPRRSWIARLLRMPPRVVNQCGQPITLLTLVVCFAFPLALFLAFTVAFHFRFSHEPLDRPDPPTSSGSSVRRSSTTIIDHASKAKPIVTRARQHSTKSSAVTRRQPRIQIEDFYESTPTPSAEELGQWVQDLLSEERDQENRPIETVPPPEENRPASPLSPKETGEVSFTQSQRDAIRKIAQDARQELEAGASPEEVKNQLKTRIEAVLNEE